MKKLLVLALAFSLFGAKAEAASSSFAGTLGSGAAFAAWCIGGTGSTCSGGVFWPSTVIANSSGVELFTSGNPAYVDTPSGSNLATLLGNPAPCLAASAYNSNSYSAGTAPTNCTLNGGYYVAPGGASVWGLGNFGSTEPTTGAAIGGQAINAEPSAASNGQMIAPALGLSGKTIMLPFSNQENAVSGVIISAMTGTSSVQLIAAVASNKLYVTHVSCSGSNSTGTWVDLQDGSSGPVLAVLSTGGNYSGESDTLFGEISTTNGNGLYAQDETTSASVKCSAQGYFGK